LDKGSISIQILIISADGDTSYIYYFTPSAIFNGANGDRHRSVGHDWCHVNSDNGAIDVVFTL
jgi:hypothetical protein